jgi:SAM-dependent methyltransferase
MRTGADLKKLVRERYAAIADAAAGCCGPTGCAPALTNLVGDAYAGVAGHVAEADLGLGCGVPTRHAGIRAGDTVLDLGSGAGNDAFVARAIVGETGRVIGVDMTDAMNARATANAARLGYANVEFRKGDIEELPVGDGTIDVVISNCVLNLVPDKVRAYAEILRVLKPGGHLCISDVVSTGTLPEAVRADAELHVGCIAGAPDRDAYLDVVRAAGFAGVTVAEARPLDLPPDIAARLAGTGAVLWSVTVAAARPATACCG